MERGELNITDMEGTINGMEPLEPCEGLTIESVERFEQRMKELLNGMIETLDNALEDTCPE